MAMHFYFNGHTYELEPGLLSWADAESNARSLEFTVGAAPGMTIVSYLAEIGSAEENAALIKNIQSSMRKEKGGSKASDGGTANYLWIGGSTGVDGSWAWSHSGTPLNSGFRNWGHAESGDQNHLALAHGKWATPSGGAGQAGQWNDLRGDNLLWSIIEWDGLIGTSDDDRLNGTSGDDTIDAGSGNDLIKSGAGNDFIDGGSGDDRIDADSGNNTIQAGEGNDRINAKWGNDTIDAGAGDDRIEAGDGDNSVVGGEGNDQIRTGYGDDVINSGEGADTVWSGRGQDIFVLDNIAVDGFDTFKDFDAGSGGSTVDKIRLDATVFTALAGGVKAEHFIKGGGLSAPSNNETGTDDHLIFDTRSGKLYYDADGRDSGSEAVLIAVIKGRTGDLGFEDFEVL